MNAIYTICTYNHIARAFSLADSVYQYSPETHFIICLIDKIADDIELPHGTELITAEDMQLSFLDEMCTKYSTLELNSALKPYFASFIFEKKQNLEQLIFLDSDILLFDDLKPVYDSLIKSSIILTPHSLSTIPEGYDFDDRIFLRSGLYNAGFFALKRDSYAFSFLEWWMRKLRNECFFDSKRGMFAEQLWLNLVPLYFEGVHILKHAGCNVAYWNLHERRIDQIEGRYFINGTQPLIFFHFSGASIKCLEENNLSEHQKRYTFTNRPDVLPLFRLYIESLKKHSFEKFSQYYTFNSKLKTRSGIIKWVAEMYKKGVKKLFYIK